MTEAVASAALPQECCRPDIYRASIPATAVPSGAQRLTIFARTMSGTTPIGRSVPLQDLIGGPSNGDGLVDPATADTALQIQMSLVVEGLSYPLLASNPQLLSEFEFVVKEAN